MEANILNGSVQVVYLQFSFSKKARIPAWIPEEEPEKYSGHKERKHRDVSGVQFVEPTPDIDISGLPSDLAEAGFVLVNAFCQPRQHVARGANSHGGRHQYYMVRFSFARSNDELSESYRTILKEKVWPAMEEKCKTLRRRVLEGGEDFAAIARAFSDGSTAPQGGDLGGEGFGPEDLAPELWDPVAKLQRGALTDVIRVESGFLILRLNHRYEKGLQPMENVKNEIMNRLYMQKLRPTLREYLTSLREQYYVMLKPGYVDTAGVEATPIIELAAANPDSEEEPKKKRKWYWPF